MSFSASRDQAWRALYPLRTIDTKRLRCCMLSRHHAFWSTHNFLLKICSCSRRRAPQASKTHHAAHFLFGERKSLLEWRFMAWVIVGLGNPGEQYDSTRHNAGRMAVEFFAKSSGFTQFREDTKRKGHV